MSKIAITDLNLSPNFIGEIKDLDHEQQVLIIGGKKVGTGIPGTIPYKPTSPSCPLYQFPDGTITHYCPGDPYPVPIA